MVATEIGDDGVHMQGVSYHTRNFKTGAISGTEHETLARAEAAADRASRNRDFPVMVYRFEEGTGFSMIACEMVSMWQDGEKCWPVKSNDPPG